MGRTVTFEVPVDTSLFTPLQLQPRSVFGLAMTGWARWLREHWVAFPRLIREHGLGVVVSGLDLDYLAPLGFFDADALTATVAVSVRAGGSLVFVDLGVAPSAGSDDVARVAAVLRPVGITDGVVLSATPTRLGADTLAGFDEDEVVRTRPRPRLRAVVAELEAGCPPIAGSSRSYTLHRHLCETADQWSAIALPDLSTEVREQLVAERSGEVPCLTAALVQPMRRIATEFRRPAFFLDEFTAECRAYERHDQLIFLHRFSSAVDMEPLATFVEWFPAVDDRFEHGGDT